QVLSSGGQGNPGRLGERFRDRHHRLGRRDGDGWWSRVGPGGVPRDVGQSLRRRVRRRFYPDSTGAAQGGSGDRVVDLRDDLYRRVWLPAVIGAGGDADDEVNRPPLA